MPDAVPDPVTRAVQRTVMPPSTGTSTGTSTAAVPPASVLLVGGHESGAASRLRPLVEDAIAVSAVGVGRDLAAAVSQALAGSDRPVCVLPMTLGRDPRLVADAARTLRWLAGPAGQGRLALCDPFGSPPTWSAGCAPPPGARSAPKPPKAADPPKPSEPPAPTTRPCW